MKRRSKKASPRTLANRSYKMKIYALCKRVQNGDKDAEAELALELEKNTLAKWAVKHWKKVQKSKKKKMIGSSPVPTLAKPKKAPLYGNAFKPFQGGAPGLGKKS